MYKKIVVLIFLLCPLLLFAQTIEAPENLDLVIKRAYSSSNTVKRLKINENNYELQKSLRDNPDIDEKIVYDLDVSPLKPLKLEKNTADNFVMIITPDFTVKFPEIGDDYYISTGFSSNFNLVNSNLSKSISPFVNLTRAFTFGYEDETETIEYDQSDLNNYIASKESYYNFEITLISSLIEIMQQKNSIEEAQTLYDEMKEDLKNQLQLKEITEGSVDYINSQLSLSTQEIKLSGLRTKLETSKANFINTYGIEPVDVIVANQPKPEIEINENGNSSLEVKKLALELAQEEIRKLTGSSQTLNLTASAGATLLATTQNVSLSVSSTYSGENFSVDATGKLLYENQKVYPSLTLSGNYSNANNNAEVDNIQLNQSKNAELLAQMDYDQALIDYKADVNKLKADIADWTIELLQLDNQLNYHKKVLEQNQKLLEKGFATSKEVQKSEDQIKKDLFNKNILYIKGKVLLLQVAVLEL